MAYSDLRDFIRIPEKVQLNSGEAPWMDVAVTIGADPATMYSAILPLPPDLDEMLIAGFLRGKRHLRY
jgi:UbiD family decarboxylase